MLVKDNLVFILD